MRMGSEVYHHLKVSFRRAVRETKQPSPQRLTQTPARSAVARC